MTWDKKAADIVAMHSKCCTHFTRKMLSEAIAQALREAEEQGYKSGRIAGLEHEHEDSTK